MIAILSIGALSVRRASAKKEVEGLDSVGSGRSTRSQTDKQQIFGLTNLPNCAIINKSPVERTLKRSDKNRIAA